MVFVLFGCVGGRLGGRGYGPVCSDAVVLSDGLGKGALEGVDGDVVGGGGDCGALGPVGRHGAMGWIVVWLMKGCVLVY